MSTLGLDGYNSLQDPHLQEFLASPQRRKHLIKNGLLKRDGTVVTDKEFKKRQHALDRREKAQDELAKRIARDIDEAIDRNRHAAAVDGSPAEQEERARARVSKLQKQRRRERAMMDVQPHRQRLVDQLSQGADPRLAAGSDIISDFYSDSDVSTAQAASPTRALQARSSSATLRQRPKSPYAQKMLPKALEQRRSQSARNPSETQSIVFHPDSARSSRPGTGQSRPRSYPRFSTSPAPRAARNRNPSTGGALGQDKEYVREVKQAANAVRSAWRRLGSARSPSPFGMDSNQGDTTEANDGVSEVYYSDMRPDGRRKGAAVFSPAFKEESSLRGLLGVRSELDSSSSLSRRKANQATAVLIVEYDDGLRHPIDRRLEIKQQVGGSAVKILDTVVAGFRELAIESRRTGDAPFGMVFLLDGHVVGRLSSCCEQRHKRGCLIDGAGKRQLRLVGVQGGRPCTQCRLRKFIESREAKRGSKGRKPNKHRREATIADDSFDAPHSSDMDSDIAAVMTPPSHGWRRPLPTQDESMSGRSHGDASLASHVADLLDLADANDEPLGLSDEEDSASTDQNASLSSAAALQRPSAKRPNFAANAKSEQEYDPDFEESSSSDDEARGSPDHSKGADDSGEDYDSDDNHEYASSTISTSSHESSTGRGADINEHGANVHQQHGQADREPEHVSPIEAEKDTINEATAFARETKLLSDAQKSQADDNTAHAVDAAAQVDLPVDAGVDTSDLTPPSPNSSTRVSTTAANFSLTGQQAEVEEREAATPPSLPRHGRHRPRTLSPAVDAMPPQHRERSRSPLHDALARLHSPEPALPLAGILGQQFQSTPQKAEESEFVDERPKDPPGLRAKLLRQGHQELNNRAEKTSPEHDHATEDRNDDDDAEIRPPWVDAEQRDVERRERLRARFHELAQAQGVQNDAEHNKDAQSSDAQSKVDPIQSAAADATVSLGTNTDSLGENGRSHDEAVSVPGDTDVSEEATATAPAANDESDPKTGTATATSSTSAISVDVDEVVDKARICQEQELVQKTAHADANADAHGHADTDADTAAAADAESTKPGHDKKDNAHEPIAVHEADKRNSSKMAPTADDGDQTPTAMKEEPDIQMKGEPADDGGDAPPLPPPPPPGFLNESAPSAEENKSQTADEDLRKQVQEEIKPVDDDATEVGTASDEKDAAVGPADQVAAAHNESQQDPDPVSTAEEQFPVLEHDGVATDEAVQSAAPKHDADSESSNTSNKNEVAAGDVQTSLHDLQGASAADVAETTAEMASKSLVNTEETEEAAPVSADGVLEPKQSAEAVTLSGHKDQDDSDAEDDLEEISEPEDDSDTSESSDDDLDELSADAFDVSVASAGDMASPKHARADVERNDQAGVALSVTSSQNASPSKSGFSPTSSSSSPQHPPVADDRPQQSNNTGMEPTSGSRIVEAASAEESAENDSKDKETSEHVEMHTKNGAWAIEKEHHDDPEQYTDDVSDTDEVVRQTADRVVASLFTDDVLEAAIQHAGASEDSDPETLVPGLDPVDEASHCEGSPTNTSDLPLNGLEDDLIVPKELLSDAAQSQSTHDIGPSDVADNQPDILTTSENISSANQDKNSFLSSNPEQSRTLTSLSGAPQLAPTPPKSGSRRRRPSGRRNGPLGPQTSSSSAEKSDATTSDRQKPNTTENGIESAADNHTVGDGSMQKQVSSDPAPVRPQSPLQLKAEDNNTVSSPPREPSSGSLEPPTPTRSALKGGRASVDSPALAPGTHVRFAPKIERHEYEPEPRADELDRKASLLAASQQTSSSHSPSAATAASFDLSLFTSDLTSTASADKEHDDSNVAKSRPSFTRESGTRSRIRDSMRLNRGRAKKSSSSGKGNESSQPPKRSSSNSASSLSALGDLPSL